MRCATESTPPSTQRREMKFRLSTKSSRKRCSWSMLYSKRAEQRRRNRCKWRLYGQASFFNALRHRPLGAVGVVVAAGCGSDRQGVSANDVAVVGDQTISKEQFDRLLDQARASYKANKQDFPEPGTEGYTALRKQAMQFLVQRAQFDQKAEELDVTITEADIDKQLATIKAQYFGKDGNCNAACEKKYRAQIAKQGLTEEQVREDVRASVVQNKLYNEVTDGVRSPTTRSTSTTRRTSSVRGLKAVRCGTSSSRRRRSQTSSTRRSRTAAISPRSRRSTGDPGSKAAGGKLTLSRAARCRSSTRPPRARDARGLRAGQDRLRLPHHPGADADQEGDQDSALRGARGDPPAAAPAEEARGDAQVGRRHVEELRGEDDLPGRLRPAGRDDHRRHPDPRSSGLALADALLELRS